MKPSPIVLCGEFEGKSSSSSAALKGIHEQSWVKWARGIQYVLKLLRTVQPQ